MSMTSEQFTEKLSAYGTAVLVYFSASWCGPCRQFKPRIEEVAKLRTDISLLLVDEDKAQDVVASYGIKSVPTVVAVSSGEEVGRFIGVKSTEELNKFINELVG